MTGAGNDIIDLTTVNIARTIHPRFYSKIIIPEEKALYDEFGTGTIPFESFVWLLWSVKESVYKFLQKNNHQLVFSPSRIIIKQISVPSRLPQVKFNKPHLEGIDFNNLPVYKCAVICDQQEFYSRSLIYEQLILSVINDKDNFCDVYWGFKEIEQSRQSHQSAAVRNFAMNKLKSFYPYDDLRFDKSVFGFPVLVKNNTETDVPLSFSHHGHFVAYSFRLNN